MDTSYYELHLAPKTSITFIYRVPSPYPKLPLPLILLGWGLIYTITLFSQPEETASFTGEIVCPKVEISNRICSHLT